LPVSPREKPVLSFSSRIILATATLLPPLVAFALAKSPWQFSIFSDRHMLPSIVPALLLVSYGLWRVAVPMAPPTALLALGTVSLSALQAAPVWSNWPGPSRQPRAPFADWLKTHELDRPVYTTWQYGIGEPVMFYLAGSRPRPIYMLPGTPPMIMDMTFY